jgi:hypothetical protein
MNAVKKCLPEIAIAGGIALLIVVILALTLSSCAPTPAASRAGAPLETTAEATGPAGCGAGYACVAFTPTPAPTVAPTQTPWIINTCGTATPTPAVQPTATPASTRVIEWDPRLDDLHISVQQVAGARYQIIAAWLTKNGQWSGPDAPPAFAKKYQNDNLGADHHLMLLCLDAAGNSINKTFVMTDGGLASATPMPYGWANFVMAGQNWDPVNGPGPYSAQALNGWLVRGFGMPHNWHWSFFVVWQEVPNYKQTEWERSGFAKE